MANYDLEKILAIGPLKKLTQIIYGIVLFGSGIASFILLTANNIWGWVMLSVFFVVLIVMVIHVRIHLRKAKIQNKMPS